MDALPAFSVHGTNNLVTIYTVHFFLVVVMLGYNLIPDSTDHDVDKTATSTAKPCPRLSASYFSKLIYAWAVPLMWTGELQLQRVVKT